MDFYPNFSEEIHKLKQINFLLSDETKNSIKTDLHLSRMWADVFWRRRENHARRDDPEIPIIFKYTPSTILEIGMAYGRVHRKIAAFNEKQSQKAELTGIEICPYCSPYFEEYSKIYPILQSTKAIFDDFLTTSKLKDDYYDIIVLPMNTFPSFPISVLGDLFNSVKKYLKPEGLWVFSTYRPKKDDVFDSKKIIGSYSGELLVEIGTDMICSQHYQFPAIDTDYGVHAVTYSSYNILSPNYKLKQREIYRNVREFINPKTLQEIIVAHNFEIRHLDNSSHSSVYVLSQN